MQHTACSHVFIPCIAQLHAQSHTHTHAQGRANLIFKATLPWLQGRSRRGQVAGHLCCECLRCLVRPLQSNRGRWPNVARGGAFSPQVRLQHKPVKGLGCGAFKVLEAFVLGSRNFIFYSLSVSVFGIQVGFLRSAALQALNSDGHATSTVQPGQIIELYGNTAAYHMVTGFFWNSRRSEHHNHIKPCFACKVRRPTLLCTVT